MKVVGVFISAKTNQDKSTPDLRMDPPYKAYAYTRNISTRGLQQMHQQHGVWR